MFHVHPEITRGIFGLAMAEKALDGWEVSGRLVDDRWLRPAKRVCAILTSHRVDPQYPHIENAGILASAELAMRLNEGIMLRLSA